jgi:hypothetical protein
MRVEGEYGSCDLFKREVGVFAADGIASGVGHRVAFTPGLGIVAIRATIVQAVNLALDKNVRGDLVVDREITDGVFEIAARIPFQAFQNGVGSQYTFNFINKRFDIPWDPRTVKRIELSDRDHRAPKVGFYMNSLESTLGNANTDGWLGYMYFWVR